MVGFLEDFIVKQFERNKNQSLSFIITLQNNNLSSQIYFGLLMNCETLREDIGQLQYNLFHSPIYNNLPYIKNGKEFGFIKIKGFQIFEMRKIMTKYSLRPALKKSIDAHMISAQKKMQKSDNVSFFVHILC